MSPVRSTPHASVIYLRMKITAGRKDHEKERCGKLWRYDLQAEGIHVSNVDPAFFDSGVLRTKEIFEQLRISGCFYWAVGFDPEDG